MLRLTLECRKHPQYKAVHLPKVNCKACLWMYNMTHAIDMYGVYTGTAQRAKFGFEAFKHMDDNTDVIMRSESKIWSHANA